MHIYTAPSQYTTDAQAREECDVRPEQETTPRVSQRDDDGDGVKEDDRMSEDHWETTWSETHSTYDASQVCVNTRSQTIPCTTQANT